MNEYEEMPISIDNAYPGSKVYRCGSARILISPPYKENGWYMSISNYYRDPTWKEIKDAWHYLVPEAIGRNAGIFFQTYENNLNNPKEHCFYVHEVKKDCVRMWKNGRMGQIFDKPSGYSAEAIEENTNLKD